MPNDLEKVENNLPDVNLVELDKESARILNQLIVETNADKSTDLTYLFNQNQNKKTAIRIDKLSSLMDVLTKQAITRFTERPDEITNKELFDGLKIIQDIIERSQRQINGQNQTPLIQINQQTNEVNVAPSQTKESRERVMTAVNNILNGILTNNNAGHQSPIINTEADEDDNKN